jgi:hypothetical protein
VFSDEEYLVSGMATPLPLALLESDVGAAKTAVVTAMVVIALRSIVEGAEILTCGARLKCRNPGASRLGCNLMKRVKQINDGDASINAV